MKIYKDIEQRTDEWKLLRLGHLTASEAQTIATGKTGLDTYCHRIVVEKITGKSQNTFIGNRHTERGNELEPEARIAYEISRDVTVNQVGFIEYDEYLGCSPDGLVGDDGGIEIKCPDDIKYFKMLVGEEKVDESYIWQCHMSLHITGRKWLDLVFYNPNFEQSMIIIRIEPDLMRREKLILGIEKGKALINELTQKYEQRI
jgi:hypothetical protein